MERQHDVDLARPGRGTARENATENPSQDRDEGSPRGAAMRGAGAARLWASSRAVASPLLLKDVRVAPSILAADFARLGAQVETVMDAGARVIHVDVMDGHFVPPISIGSMIVGCAAPSWCMAAKDSSTCT